MLHLGFPYAILFFVYKGNKKTGPIPAVLRKSPDKANILSVPGERTMKLEWMGRHRSLVEAHIKSANRYAQRYHVRWFRFEDVSLSSAQIQVMEYILEVEHSNMSELAERLGITRSALTKHVQALESFALVEKEHPKENAKSYTLRVTEKGLRAYQAYSEEIQTRLFAPIFSALDEMSDEDLERLQRVYDLINR